jgi:pimeloyl-ACP methyl ester carboxylesterase
VNPRFTGTDDLDAVARHLGLERFALFGQSCGTPVGIAYAARRPDESRWDSGV